MSESYIAGATLVSDDENYILEVPEPQTARFESSEDMSVPAETVVIEAGAFERQFPELSEDRLLRVCAWAAYVVWSKAVSYSDRKQEAYLAILKNLKWIKHARKPYALAVKIASASTTMRAVATIAAGSRVRCAISMKKAMPSPVPNSTPAPTRWISLSVRTRLPIAPAHAEALSPHPALTGFLE